MTAKVDAPGIYVMPLLDYVNDPAPEPSASTGTLHAMITHSPMHAKLQHPRLNPDYQGQASSRMDLGTVAHAVLLEGDESRVFVIHADDWRTKAAKESRDMARAAGKVPILEKDMFTVRLMVERASDALFSSELCEAWMSAQPEQTLVWQERGIWCRSRADKLTPPGSVYFEYKTTADAHPMTFCKGPVIRQGYDLQAALGLRGVKAVLHREQCQHVFIVQEIEEPYAVSLVSLSPHFLAIANARLDMALDRWGDCLKEGRWPGYPNRPATVDPPGYYGMDDVDLREGFENSY